MMFAFLDWSVSQRGVPLLGSNGLRLVAHWSFAGVLHRGREITAQFFKYNKIINYIISDESQACDTAAASGRFSHC
jgi:hypothetical protein